jgi:hypothetical protein
MPSDIEMERTNVAQAQTNLVADGNFHGQFVFAVGVGAPPAGDLQSSFLNGFSAQGYSGGTGVTGFGGGGGTGVSGKGGAGGKGVDAGAGVIAVGGLSDRFRGPDSAGGDNRNPNAPGVVGISGGEERSQSTTLAETANVGVFGQGGDRVENTRRQDAVPDFVVGPAWCHWPRWDTPEQ